MEKDKRQKLIEAFVDYASDYANRTVKDSGEVSIKTNIHDGYFTSTVYFSLDFAKPSIGNTYYDKDAAEFARVFIDMHKEFQKKCLNKVNREE